jgi:pyruvate-ferredoxin/flavodoxin oxidoreductase
MSYGHVYVARVAFGAKMSQTLQALQEAEAYPGPSLVIAYSHCIAHGYDMAFGVEQQKLATSSGIWPLYRYDPRRVARGEPPLHLDSGPPRTSLADYMRNEGRFRVVEKADSRRFQRLLKAAETLTRQRYAVYQQLAGITVPLFEASEKEGPAPAAEPR